MKWEKTFEKIKAGIKKFDVKKMSVEDIARKADMHDWYISAYADLSDSVHTSPRDLENFIDKKDNGIAGLKNIPSDEDLDKIHLTAGDSLLRALKAINNIFKLEIDSSLETYAKQPASLYTKYNPIKGGKT